MRISITRIALILAAGGTLAVLSHLPSTPAVPAAPAKLSGADLCRRDLTKLVAFRDPESVRITGVFRGKDLADGTTAYQVVVNAKNGFGGYTGDQVYDCFASEREQRAVAAAPI